MAGRGVLLLVGLNFTASQGEEEFNEWYIKIRLPDVLKAPGVVGANRYIAAQAGEGQPKYLAVYEIEGKRQ